MVALFWIKFRLSLFAASLRRLFPLVYSRHLTILGSCHCKNKLTSVFHASALLLMINFVITTSKFTAEPLWQRYDAIYHQQENRRIKTDVNLLTSRETLWPFLKLNKEYCGALIFWLRDLTFLWQTYLDLHLFRWE